MKATTHALIAVAACCWIPHSAQAATACTLEALTQYMRWCFDDSHEVSEYQKTGRNEIIQGRFCKQGGLIADGFMICLGHDAKALMLANECWRDTHMKAAAAVLPDDDPRKPAQCPAK